MSKDHSQVYQDHLVACASMTPDQLEADYERIMARKKETAHDLTFAETAVGKRMIEEDRANLEKARSSYINIKPSQDAEIAMRELVCNQTRENMLAARVYRFASAKKVQESLDEELAACHDARRSREEQPTR